MTDVLQLPASNKRTQGKSMPPRKRFNGKHVNARLDEASDQALSELKENHNFDDSNAIRYALIEQAKRERRMRKSSKIATSNT